MVSMSYRYVSCGMLVVVQFLFARPVSAGRLRLPGQPVLESWMAVGHPDQQRLAGYLDELERLTVGAMGDRRHLSLELRVGLGASVPLISNGNDRTTSFTRSYAGSRRTGSTSRSPTRIMPDPPLFASATPVLPTWPSLTRCSASVQRRLGKPEVERAGIRRLSKSDSGPSSSWPSRARSSVHGGENTQLVESVEAGHRCAWPDAGHPKSGKALSPP